MGSASWADIKRLYECLSADYEFIEQLEKDPYSTLKSVQIRMEPEEALETVKAMRSSSYDTHPYFSRYLPKAQKILNSIEERMSSDNYVCKDLYAVGSITKKRMNVQNKIMRMHPNIRYFPVIFELSDGCSVGCPFCGFNSGALTGVFRYTEANSRLWKQILNTTLDTVGIAAGSGVCYFATEPFDNPDYECFIKDYSNIFGHVPQTTTAVADRDPERFRRFMASIKQEDMEEAAIRISIRTKDQFYRIMSEYTPKELKDIELICNNPESVNRYSSSGRAMKEGPEYENYSISCLAGLRVNMVTKTIIYEEPESPSDEFLTGERFYEKTSFEDEPSYRRGITRLIETYASGRVKVDDILFLSPGVKVKREGNQIAFYGDGCVLRMTGNKEFMACVELLARDRASLKKINEELGLSSFSSKLLCDKINVVFMYGYLRRLPCGWEY